MLMITPGQLQISWEHTWSAKTQTTGKNNYFCWDTEQLREHYANRKSATDSGTARATEKVSIKQCPFPPTIFNVATFRDNTLLAMTCSSNAVLSVSHLSVLFLVYTEIFHLSCNPYWISFPQGDVPKDFEMSILAMSFKRHWTEVPSFFIPCSNLLSRQNCKVWKSFTCVHAAMPCRIHLWNRW